jgi:hypothetical protein
MVSGRQNGRTEDCLAHSGEVREGFLEVIVELSFEG